MANVQQKPLTLKGLLTTYSDVFKEELGTLSGVPYALRDAVNREMQRLESLGVIESVAHSDWATPLVAVPKSDGSVRLCGDYSKTVNPVLETDQYPLPWPEDLMTCLTGGCKFTKLDLSSAYQQMVLDDESCHSKYSKGAIQILTFTIWCVICTGCVPESNGHNSPGVTTSNLLPGRYPGDRLHSTRTLAEFGSSLREIVTAWH